MDIVYYLLKFYFYINTIYTNFSDKIINWYNDLEMLIINDTITEIYFYSFDDMRKITLRNNTTMYRVILLLIKKYLCGASIAQDTELVDFTVPLLLTNQRGLFEFVYYKDRKHVRYYTKHAFVNIETITQYSEENVHKKFLYATIDDKYDVTWFINEHITSFHRRNQIIVSDIVSLLYINKHKVPEECDHGHYLKLVDDDTIEETIIKDNEAIILTKI
jgi:hypothetical protein